MTELAFPYEDLWYLKGAPGDKIPAEKWGGYGTDFTENPNVYTHDEVVASDHDYWLLNGYRSDAHHLGGTLLVFDIDVHKAPESFDPDRVGVPTNTPLIKSQSGGFHTYALINNGGQAQESDFIITHDLPGEFDIDIRGEYVKHHVVAPTEIPGVSTPYTIVNDEPIKRYFRPDEAARALTLDGEPLLQYKAGSAVNLGSVHGYEREEIDPPTDLPTCYGAGLELRKKAPENPNLNTHKVNVLTALCGVAVGFDIETVASHFVEKYYPGEPSQADIEKTEYQIKHIAQKYDAGEYDAPSLTTLRQYHILPIDEGCNCEVHDYEADTSPYYNINLGDIAVDEGLGTDPYNDGKMLTQVCLEARERFPALKGETPPYNVLKWIAEDMGLPFKDKENDRMGKDTYEVVKRVWKDMRTGEV